MGYAYDVDMSVTKMAQLQEKIQHEMDTVEKTLLEAANAMKARPGETDTVMLAIAEEGREVCKEWDELILSMRHLDKTLRTIIDNYQSTVDKGRAKMEEFQKS